MKKKPTKKQLVLLEFIEEFTLKNDFSPSYREIMDAMGLRSVSAVAEHIDNCVEAGFIKRLPKAARSLEVVKQKTYDETMRLIKGKLVEFEGDESRTADAETLKRAAEILEIEL
ncbi:MAG: LexA family protein [Candidatus Saccharimonadales bacterium]